MTKTDQKHEVAYQELLDFLKRYEKQGVSSAELLAIAANMVGKLAAMQDARFVTVEQAMTIIEKNMILGNQQVVDEIMNTKGNA